MGQTHPSHSSTSEDGAFRNMDIMKKVTNILSEKEYIFLTIRTDIESAVLTKNFEVLKSLEDEVNKHISELTQLRQQNLQVPRIDKVLYNYQLCLAKLRSFLNLDKHEHSNDIPHQSHEVTNEEFEQMVQEFAEVNRPITDQDQENDAGPSHNISRNSTTVNKTKEVESDKTENEIALDVNTQQKPSEEPPGLTDEDIDNELKNLSLEKTKNTECLPHEEYGDLAARSGSEDLYNEKRINELEMMYDSCCSEKDYKNLEEKVFAFVNLIHTSNSKNRITWVKQTIELLEKIKATRRSLFSSQNSDSETNTIGKDYLSLWEARSLRNNAEDSDSLEHADEDDDSIYSNFEVNRQHLSDSFNNTQEALINKEKNYHPHRPTTIYSNMEVIRQHQSTLDHNFLNSVRLLESAALKPPVPNPRRHEDKLMKDLAVFWEKLYDIGEKKNVTLNDVHEVEEMQKYLEVAQNMFKKKIEGIIKKYEDATRDTVDV